MRVFNTFLLLIIFSATKAQDASIKKVLFIGNSYIYYNNLPQICVGIAASMGDVLITDQSTVGGYSLKQHFTDTNTINKIKKGTQDYNNNKARMDWDYVVLQEQSTLLSYPDDAVERNVFTYVHYLDSTITKYNPTSKKIFYMTWGRKNGDKSRCATWPPACTYKGMDSIIALNYTLLAKKENGLLSPVGQVWNQLREKFPLLELYNADESHPSESGSYAAACSFYTILFGKDPVAIKYNYTLKPEIAADIRKVVQQVVYNNLSKWINGN